MKKYLLASLFAALAFVSGCSTLVNGSVQNISITSNVAGADIEFNGGRIGSTPFTGAVKRGASTTVTLKKEGYKTKTVVLDTAVEPIFWGNFIIGGTLGSTTDAANGNMYKYMPGTINIDLEKN